jgi:hypothetical protein
MTQTSSQVGFNVSVNEDGQLVFTIGEVRTPVCSHIMAPVVVTRARSLAIAKAVIAAQEGDGS